MWIDVKYREKLNLGQVVRVKSSQHLAKIIKVTDKLHCFTYQIEPKDPQDAGGYWFFSHQFEKQT